MNHEPDAERRQGRNGQEPGQTGLLFFCSRGPTPARAARIAALARRSRRRPKTEIAAQYRTNHQRRTENGSRTRTRTRTKNKNPSRRTKNRERRTVLALPCLAISQCAIVATMSLRRPDTSLPAPESFLPLPRDTFHILVSLADRERHGYSVMQDVAERTDGALRLSPSSLYASIKRLLGQGLIEELDERPESEARRPAPPLLPPLPPGPAGCDGRSTAARPPACSDARATGLLPRQG